VIVEPAKGEAGLVVVGVHRPGQWNSNPGNCPWTAAMVAAIASLPSASTSGST
jgi:hypothetical protein